MAVGLALAMAVVAGCSSTTGPSAAVQDDASGSFAPSASLAAGPSAPPASEDAGVASAPSTTDMPSSDSASQLPSQGAVAAEASSGTAPANGDSVCDSGLQYACGDSGPNGGTVFYATASPFPCGANLASSCNFMEVAPNGWNGTEVDCPNGCGTADGSVDKTSDFGSSGIGTGTGFIWCVKKTFQPAINGAAGLDIGTGYSNTMAMVSSSSCSSNSAGVLAYNYGGTNTWFLPSLYEAIALFNYTGRNQIGGFAAAQYWTSSAASPQNNSYSLSFNSGNYSLQTTEGYTNGVRPITAF